MKRTLAFVLALSMTLILGAAMAAPQQMDMDRTLDTTERAEAEAITFAMYPIGTEVVLNIWGPMNSAAAKYIDSYNDNEAMQVAAARTGVTLNFLHPAGGQEREQFNLLTASGNLPDIMQVNAYYPGGVQAGVTDGLFADLTGLVAEYSPTYNMILENVEDFWRDATNQDGQVLAYYRYKEATAYEEGDHTRIQTRTDWMDEIGLEALYTWADYEKYFDHILATKPGVVPFGLHNAGYDAHMLTAYGMLNGYFKVDDVIHHMYNEPALLDYLTLMNEWYKKGYISPDFTSAKNEQLFLAGQVGGFVGNTANIAMGAPALGIEAGPQPYVRVTEGQLVHGPYKLVPNNNSGEPTQISASSKHIKEAMMFMDYGYTLEGCYNYCFGPKDLAWIMGENGLPQYTDYILNNDRFASMTDLNYVIRYHVGIASMRALDRDSLPYMTDMPEVRAARIRWMDDPNMDLETAMPNFTLSEEATSERAAIMTDVDTYAKEMILKFIVGAELLENFDQYLQTLDSFGIERALELTQEAYDVYRTKHR